MSRKVGQYLVLILFLVVFPLVSWLYLRQGLDYRLEALEKLEDLGPIGHYRVPLDSRDTLDLTDLKGNVVLASFFSLDDQELAPLFGDRLRRLNGQFGGRPEVVFLQHSASGEAAGEKASAFRDTYALSDPEQCLFAFLDAAEARRLMKEAYRLPEPSGGDIAPGSPFFALADTLHTIRRYYDVRSEDSMRELVEHLAIVIPPIVERDLVFKREKEK